jgi:hypothetical protein
MAEERHRDLHHVVARPRNVEQGAEQHEQEDELHRHPERDPVYALGGQPHVRDQALEARALVLDHLGHVGPREDVEEEDAGGDQHAEAHGPPGGLEHDYDPDDAHHEVDVRRRARPLGDLGVEEVQVGSAEGSHRGERPVGQGHGPTGRGLERGKEREREEDRDREVDGARLGVVEQAEAQDERQRRGVPDLEQRPATRDQREEEADPAAGLPATEVGLLDELLELLAAERLLLLHRASARYLIQPFSL